MTGVLSVFRDTVEGLWASAWRATAFPWPVDIASPDFEGDRTTFNFAAAGARMAISGSGGNGA